MSTVLSVDGLRREYGTTVAVENISFHVGAGEVVGLGMVMPSLPLLSPSDSNHTVAWRNGERVSAHQFLHEVRQLATQLPEQRFVFNLCSDRYRFLTTFYAAMVRGQTNLLPPNHAEKSLVQMHALYPDSYVISDQEVALPLPLYPYPECTAANPGIQETPRIVQDALAAILFTSGSTGEPQPYGKPGNPWFGQHSSSPDVSTSRTAARWSLPCLPSTCTDLNRA